MKVQCPHCKQVSSVPEAFAEQHTKCLHCGGTFITSTPGNDLSERLGAALAWATMGGLCGVLVALPIGGILLIVQGWTWAWIAFVSCVVIGALVGFARRFSRRELPAPESSSGLLPKGSAG